MFLDGMQHLVLGLAIRVVLKTTSSVSEALDYFARDYKFDLVICDIYLPGMSGFDLIQSIRSRKINVKIVVVSSTEDGRDIQQLVDLCVLIAG